MEKLIHIIRAARTKFLDLANGLSTAELNSIPPGFNNNIAWQIGHIVVSQQILCYKLANLPFVIEEDLVPLYRNGSKPERPFSEEEIEQMKNYLLGTIDQLETDLKNNAFVNYTPYTISTYAGVTLESVEDALTFIVSHDALHYGCSIGLRRLVKNSI